jgi:DNA-binding response OmpR family regulator
MSKRILVISHDRLLRETRSTLLLKAGYLVANAENGETALKLLESDNFDLVLVGRDSIGVVTPVDQQLRDVHPQLLILKVVDVISHHASYATQVTDAVPINVLMALKGMLGTKAG